MNVKNLGIRAKLMGGFGLVLVIALGQNLLSIQQLHQVSDKSTEIADHWLPSVKALGDLNDDLNELRLARVQLTMVEETSKVEPVAQQLAKLHESMAAHQAAYAKLISSPKEKELFAELEARIKAYNGYSSQLVKLMRDLNAVDAKAIASGDGRKAYEACNELLDKLIETNTASAHHAAEEADAIYARSRMLLLAGLAVMVGLGLGIAWFVSRSLVGTASRAVRQAERIADGDLTHTVHADSQDEMGRLLEALIKMQHKLRDIVAGVRQNAEGVATASAEIARGNQDLSGRTEQQASALEETAASMEELSSTVKQNADNARQANQLALSASTVAVSGGDVVNRMVETMRGIEESSKRIADIIGTIDGIAFQTNILALNAAVEAARAGEQGRGFAVVASEVRSLAQRSAEAAKEIKSLIGASVERVEQGTTLADQAGTTMQEVVASIKRVTDIMGEISAASIEQSAGVAQVGEAVSQMDQATQQNAALVEESAAAAESLKGQAEKLVGAVAVFKLAAQEAVHMPAAPVARMALAPVAAMPRAQAKPGRPAARPAPAASVAEAPAPVRAPAAAPAMATTADDWETF